MNSILKPRVLESAFHVIIATSMTSLLSACGGGDGGIEEQGNTGTARFALEVPGKITGMPATGTPSFMGSLADFGLATALVPATSGDGGRNRYGAATSPQFQMSPTAHIDDSVRNAWLLGWTGAGVTISVIDDFRTVSASANRQSPLIAVPVTYDDGKATGVRSMAFSWTVRDSHGGMVSNIVGGDHQDESLSASITATVTSDTQTECRKRNTLTGEYTQACNGAYEYSTSLGRYVYDGAYGPLVFYSSFFGGSERQINLNFRKVPGIASKALVVNNHVTLSSSRNPIQTVADIQGHLQNSAYLGVINLSIGAEIPTSGRSFDQVMAEVDRFPLFGVDAVIAVAAGNGGAACATQDLNGCNALAVAMAFQPATRGSTIVVGALAGSGSSQNIATYSTRAGILAQRFVLAPGEEGEQGIQGTSFAAPRVAGIAAILKQKFPTLTSSQIASVILLSASKDIDNDGRDDFAGVSPIYGHGKASLTRALDLLGALQ
jgi:subtilisin family serine protease